MHDTPTITLPPRSDGRRPATVDNPGRLLIIGANGSGKTRFSDRMAADLGNQAFCISPIAALYGTAAADESRQGIDTVYAAMRQTSPLLMPEGSPVPPSQLEKLMALLLSEEVANLIRYKVVHASDPDTVMEPTRLDMVIERWKEMFPDNDVLIEGGKLLFSRTADSDARPSIKLSAGEKVILYYFGAVLYAPAHAVIMVDNPGMFLHPSVIRRLWDSVEALRPDCRFIYTTHDLDFASSRPSSVTCWVRDFNAAAGTWDYDLLPPDSELTDRAVSDHPRRPATGTVYRRRRPAVDRRPPIPAHFHRLHRQIARFMRPCHRIHACVQQSGIVPPPRQLRHSRPRPPHRKGG